MDVYELIIDPVAKCLKGTYPDGVPMPDGVRLEMNPYFYRFLIRDALFYGDSPAEAMEKHFPVPVKVTPDIPLGSWRLVVVTEQLLLEGLL
ncbi:MAG TPA: hypothetical protein VG142_08060 [Trebonia sp.]|jgi:hypothetical protein|nr:hypothetical protein [Trebonia sp.]